MILLYIFILIFICPIKPQIFKDIRGFPSFRSSVVRDGKPILRGGGPEQEEYVEPSENGSFGDGKLTYDAVPEEEDIDQTEIASTYNNDIAERNTAVQKRQNLLDDISVLIEWLVEKYGYNLAVKYRRDDGVTGENLFTMRARHKKQITAIETDRCYTSKTSLGSRVWARPQSSHNSIFQKGKNKKKQSKKRKGSKGRKKGKRTSDNYNNSETNNLYDASSEKNSNERENVAKTITENANIKNILPENSNTKNIFPENLNNENIKSKTGDINTRTGDNTFDKHDEDDDSSKLDTHNKGLNVEIKPIEMDLTDIVKMIRSNMPNIVYGGQQNSDTPSALAEMGKNMPNVSIAFSVQI